MASDANVIKEFLVSIGLKVDSTTLSKFNGFMAGTAKTVFTLASALTAAATGIEVFVTTVAGKMEDLYWSSQRLHDSVGNIQDYALGIQNLGGSAQAARASLESVMRLLRTNPGYGGLLANLGVDPKQGATGIMEGLRRRFQAMPYFIATQYANLLGIDEATLWSMMQAKGRITGSGAGSGTFNGLYHAIGMDPNKAAKAAHDFMVQLRGMEAEFTVLAEVIGYKLTPFAKMFTEWLSSVARNVATAITSVSPEAWTQLAGTMSDLGGAVGALLPSLKEMVSFITSTSAVLVSSLKVARDVLNGDFGKAWNDAKPVGTWAQNMLTGVATGLDNWIQKVFAGPVSTQQREAMEFFVNKGLTREQAAGIVGNMQWESGMNFRASGDRGNAFGYMQWQGRRQDDFKAWAGHDIHESTPYEQLQFTWYELLHKQLRSGQALRMTTSAAEAALAISNLYERPLNPAASARQRIALAEHMMGVTLNQKTDIHINGAMMQGGDMHRLFAPVVQQQRRVNGDLVRNLKPALQ